MTASFQTGFESGVDEPTRRALFDLQRRISLVETSISGLAQQYEDLEARVAALEAAPLSEGVVSDREQP